MMMMMMMMMHSRFRLVPKSMTLDDLERPFRTLFQNACVIGTHHKNFNEDRPLLSAAKMYSAMAVVSGNITFMQIFAGILGDEVSNDSGVIENDDFQGFRTLHLRHLRKWGQHYYIVLYLVTCRLSSNPKIRDLEWPWTCSECCRRTLNRNEQLRHRAVFCDSTDFLYFVVGPILLWSWVVCSG